MNRLFSKGDRVRIVKYGHIMRSSEKMGKPWVLLEEQPGTYVYDASPHAIGKEGVVDHWVLGQHGYKYSLTMDDPTLKSSWYNQEQLEYVKD